MPAKITYGVENMLAEANAAVTTLSVAEAQVAADAIIARSGLPRRS